MSSFAITFGWIFQLCRESFQFTYSTIDKTVLSIDEGSIGEANNSTSTISKFGVLLNIFCLVVIYSLVLDILFGHRSYWRRFSVSAFQRSLFYPVRAASRLFLKAAKTIPFANEEIRIQNAKGFHNFPLDRCSDDVVIRCLGYLNADDLLQLEPVSKRMQRLTRMPQLWMDLGALLMVPSDGNNNNNINLHMLQFLEDHWDFVEDCIVHCTNKLNFYLCILFFVRRMLGRAVDVPFLGGTDIHPTGSSSNNTAEEIYGTLAPTEATASAASSPVSTANPAEKLTGDKNTGVSQLRRIRSLRKQQQQQQQYQANRSLRYGDEQRVERLNATGAADQSPATHPQPPATRVMIKGVIYDLTRFISEHPGGAAIIAEWAGRDATRTFELATHSTFAVALAECMAMWPPERFLDVPRTLRRAVRETRALNSGHIDGDGGDNINTSSSHLNNTSTSGISNSSSIRGSNSNGSESTSALYHIGASRRPHRGRRRMPSCSLVYSQIPRFVALDPRSRNLLLRRGELRVKG